MKDHFFGKGIFFSPGISFQEFFFLEISLQVIFPEITDTPPQESNGRPLLRRIFMGKTTLATQILRNLSFVSD